MNGFGKLFHLSPASDQFSSQTMQPMDFLGLLFYRTKFVNLNGFAFTLELNGRQVFKLKLSF